MHERPPDEDGAPRLPSAEIPENVVVIPRTDPNGGEPATQAKIAVAVATDPFAGIRERTLAARAVHRLGLGLPVDPADALKLTTVYQQRRHQLALLWQAYR